MAEIFDTICVCILFFIMFFLWKKTSIFYDHFYCRLVISIKTHYCIIWFYYNTNILYIKKNK